MVYHAGFVGPAATAESRCREIPRRNGTRILDRDDRVSGWVVDKPDIRNVDSITHPSNRSVRSRKKSVRAGVTGRACDCETFWVPEDQVFR